MQVSRQSAWDLVAHELGLSLAKALELQQIFVSELLHCEHEAQAQSMRQRQQHQQRQHHQQRQQLLLHQAQELAQLQPPSQTVQVQPQQMQSLHTLVTRQLGQPELLQSQQQVQHAFAHSVQGGAQVARSPASFTSQLQQVVAASNHVGPTDGPSEQYLPSIDARLLGSGVGGPVLGSRHAARERDHPGAASAVPGSTLDDLYLM
jgi:hypothetical protein